MMPELLVEMLKKENAKLKRRNKKLEGQMAAAKALSNSQQNELRIYNELKFYLREWVLDNCPENTRSYDKWDYSWQELGYSCSQCGYEN